MLRSRVVDIISPEKSLNWCVCASVLNGVYIELERLKACFHSQVKSGIAAHSSCGSSKILSISSFVGRGLSGLYLSQICFGVTAKAIQSGYRRHLLGGLTFMQDASHMVDACLKQFLAI